MATTLATAITSDTERLKQYLKDVYTVEKELYCSQRAAEELERKIQAVKKAPHYPSAYELNAIRKLPFAVLLAIYGWWVIAALAVLFYYGEYMYNFYNHRPNYDAFVWGTTAAIVVIGIVVAILIHHIFAKDAERRRNAAVREIDEKHSEELSTLVPSYQAIQHVYAQSIASCEKTLEQLYSSDIIFSKYRNLVSVSQFYEYFMSGRCTTLEGHEGAYNLYENEARQDIIITKLDRVISLLEEIRDTQYQLLEAISESNALLRDIANNTAALAYSNAAIAYNTAAIARNTMW